jgi:hypothetical protein
MTQHILYIIYKPQSILRQLTDMPCHHCVVGGGMLDDMAVDDIAALVTALERDDATAEYDHDPPIAAEIAADIATANEGKNKFEMLDDDELERFEMEQANMSTARKTLAHVGVFTNFLRVKGEVRPPHVIPP